MKRQSHAVRKERKEREWCMCRVADESEASVKARGYYVQGS